MNFEQFFNETMQQTTEEKRTIKCAVALEGGDVRFYSLTPSQYSLLMYLSEDEVNFYDSRVIPLDEGSFEKF